MENPIKNIDLQGITEPLVVVGLITLAIFMNEEKIALAVATGLLGYIKGQSG